MQKRSRWRHVLATCRLLAVRPRAGVLVLLGTLLWAAAATPAAQGGAQESGAVLVAEYDGIIHPVAVEFFDDAVARADETSAAALIIVLRTPGGLLDSTRTIVTRMIGARTPVVVFVGPSGSRAASAGFLITLAADVAVMAPGTHIGAAHPVSVGNDQAAEETTMAKKAAEDAAAYARTLAKARGRNTALAAEAVLESRAFTETEALQAEPPLIDFIAKNLEDLVQQLDGRRVTRFDGRAVSLETTGVAVTRMEMTRRQQFLSAIAHPQLAYLFLSLGMLGLVVELWNPGAILPGVAGGLCLLLAFFAFQVLPINATGLALILFGLVLLLLELKVPSFGALGIGGTIALLVGSLMVTREVPGVQVSTAFVAPVALSVAAILLFLGRLSLRAQRQPATTGAEGIVGAHGVVLVPLAPGSPGQIRVHGEIWRAESAAVLPAGARVRVTALDGLTARVSPVPSDVVQGDPS